MKEEGDEAAFLSSFTLHSSTKHQPPNHLARPPTTTLEKMIVYSVICRARDAAVLVEVSSDSSDGNVPQVTLALLEHLSQAGPQAIGERDLKTYVHRNEQNAGDIFSQVVQACTTMSIQTKEELDLGDEEHFFHLWTEDGVFYCCLSDDPDPRRHKV